MPCPTQLRVWSQVGINETPSKMMLVMMLVMLVMMMMILTHSGVEYPFKTFINKNIF